MEEFDTLAGFLEHVRSSWTRKRRRRRARQPDDAARRQGTRIRNRVPARLGRRSASRISGARRAGPRGARGGAPARPCRADAARHSAPRSPSPRTAALMACGSRRFPRASSTSCRSTMSRWPRTEACMAATGRAASTRPKSVRAADSTRRRAGSARSANRPRGEHAAPPRAREPITIDGTLVAASTVGGAGLEVGVRVFHQKFGYGRSRRSTATSSPSISTRPGARRWWIASSSGPVMRPSYSLALAMMLVASSAER